MFLNACHFDICSHVRVTLEKMVPVDGKELRAMVEKEINANEKKNKEILDQHVRR